MNKENENLNLLINLVEKIKTGESTTEVIKEIDPGVAGLANSILELGQILEKRFQEMKKILSITQQINSGVRFEEVMDFLYHEFNDLIPYDRIGLALLSCENKTLTAEWAKSKAENIFIKKGYSSTMENSSLEKIIKTNEPRIINDLEKYFVEHPVSESTGLALKEGIRSSLTCPLIVSTRPIGFIFFSSFEKNTYDKLHVSLFQEIAGHISIIIEKSKLYTEILLQKKKLEELNEIKNRFLGIAAHDLRNPLGITLSYSEYLSDSIGEVSPAELIDIINDIKSSSKEMLTLVNDLLDISKIESGTIELEKEKADFTPYITKVVEKNRMLAKPKNIGINLQVPDKSYKVYFDRNKISQILNNLITNAVKFSLPGKDINVAVTYLPEVISIEVIDQGPGIEETDIEKLFQGFYRGKNKPTAGEKSTGLGLAICKKMIEAHNGSIEVKSKPGEGSIFKINLPVDLNYQ